jgi:hypothetical protein
MRGDNGMKSSPSCAEGTYHMHLGSLLCTYVYLISGSSNTHPMVSHFIIDKLFHLFYNVTPEVEGFICKKIRHCWMNIEQSRFKMCICI